MKTPLLISDTHVVEELQRITDLICECNNVAFVILFGSYAGMEYRSALGGYELLVLTTEEPLLGGSETCRYVEEHFPKEMRLEERLIIYVNSLQMANSEYHHSYFCYVVRNEGVLFYNCHNYKLWRKNSFNCLLAYQRAKADTEKYLSLGKLFLRDAVWHFVRKEYRIAATNIYLAASVLYYTVARVYYRYNTSEADNFHATYTLASHISPELANLWKVKDDMDHKYSFYYLYSLNYQSRFKSEFNCPPKVIRVHLEKVKLLAQIVEKECNKRVELLNGMLSQGQ